MITTTIFPRRYVQGYNALEFLSDESARLGSKALLLADPFVHEAIFLNCLLRLKGTSTPRLKIRWRMLRRRN